MNRSGSALYISKFFNPIQNLAEQFNWLQSAFASAEKVFSILDLEPKMQDAPDAIELTDIRGEIEFRDVWFSYIPGECIGRDEGAEEESLLEECFSSPHSFSGPNGRRFRLHYR